MLIDFKKEKFDIIVSAGQSNSEGFGHGDVEKPYTPNDKIWMYNCKDDTIHMAREWVHENYICGNLSLSFADEYVKSNMLCDDRKLLIVNINAGSSGFVNGRWGMKDDLYNKMIEMTKDALELNLQNKLVAFLWHQGETDAKNLMTYETHYNNLSKLVNSFMKIFDCHNIPFIMGNFCYQWAEENKKATEPVINAIKDVSSELNKSLFVDTQGLKSNDEVLGDGDTIHFSRSALYDLGKRYFLSYKDLV